MRPAPIRAILLAAALPFLSSWGTVVPQPQHPHPPHHAPPREDPDLGAAIERGRVLLDGHCGTCHSPDRPDAKPQALAVFSTGDPDWSVRMTDAQLCATARRIRGSRGVPPSEAIAYDDGIDRILARRGAPRCADSASTSP